MWAAEIFSKSKNAFGKFYIYHEIYKEFSSIIAIAKENFSNRFLQFRKMETTLCFLTSPEKAKCKELDLSCLHWLDLGNLEMELLKFQESSIWKNKSYDLRATLEKIEECEGMTKDSTVASSENEILKVWNSLPNNFKSIKALGIAFLTLGHPMLVSSCFQHLIISNMVPETD